MWPIYGQTKGQLILNYKTGRLWPGKRSSDKIRINWDDLGLDQGRSLLSCSSLPKQYCSLGSLSNPLLFHFRKFGLGSGTFFLARVRNNLQLVMTIWYNMNYLDLINHSKILKKPWVLLQYYKLIWERFSIQYEPYLEVIRSHWSMVLWPLYGDLWCK